MAGQASAGELFSAIAALPPGPNAKFIENTQKAYDNATTDKARENIAKDSAAREGMKNRGKVQNVPQGMMDFGMSGSFGTKDQPGLFSSPSEFRQVRENLGHCSGCRPQDGGSFKAELTAHLRTNQRPAKGGFLNALRACEAKLLRASTFGGRICPQLRAREEKSGYDAAISGTQLYERNMRARGNVWRVFSPHIAPARARTSMDGSPQKIRRCHPARAREDFNICAKHRARRAIKLKSRIGCLSNTLEQQ